MHCSDLLKSSQLLFCNSWQTRTMLATAVFCQTCAYDLKTIIIFESALYICCMSVVLIFEAFFFVLLLLLFEISIDFIYQNIIVHNSIHVHILFHSGWWRMRRVR